MQMHIFSVPKVNPIKCEIKKRKKSIKKFNDKILFWYFNEIPCLGNIVVVFLLLRMPLEKLK